MATNNLSHSSDDSDMSDNDSIRSGSPIATSGDIADVVATTRNSLAATSQALAPLASANYDQSAVIQAAAKSMSAVSQSYAAIAKLFTILGANAHCAAPGPSANLASQPPVDATPGPSSNVATAPEYDFSFQGTLNTTPTADRLSPRNRRRRGQHRSSRRSQTSSRLREPELLAGEQSLAAASTKRPESLLLDLPFEIKEMIYRDFDLETFKTVRLVCKPWNQLATPFTFKRVKLHRCELLQHDFDMFQRLCLGPAGDQIESIAMCDARCTRESLSTTLDSLPWLSPVVITELPNKDVHLDTEKEKSRDFLFHQFLRERSKMHLSAKFTQEQLSFEHPKIRPDFLDHLVGLESLTISQSHLVNLFGKDSHTSKGLLGHVLFPRVHTIRLQEVTGRLFNIMQLLLPHKATLKHLVLERVTLQSQDWRTFLTDLGHKHKDVLNLETITLQTGKTNLFNDPTHWKPMVVNAFGPGRIEATKSEKPARIYCNGFQWKSAAASKGSKT